MLCFDNTHKKLLPDGVPQVEHSKITKRFLKLRDSQMGCLLINYSKSAANNSINTVTPNPIQAHFAHAFAFIGVSFLFTK